MRIDKKARADRLRFVVLDALAKPRILDDPDPTHLVAAWEQVRRSPKNKGQSGTIDSDFYFTQKSGHAVVSSGYKNVTLPPEACHPGHKKAEVVRTPARSQADRLHVT